MRQELKTLSKFAFASAIAEKQLESQSDLSEADRALFEALEAASNNAFKCWPLFGKLTPKDVEKMRSGLSSFLARVGWDHWRIHIPTVINFCLEQMTCLLEIMIDAPDRRVLVARVAEAALAIYERFSSGKDREYALCIQAGIAADRVWDDVLNGY